jgi:Flp pilus assembly protein CpaB
MRIRYCKLSTGCLTYNYYWRRVYIDLVVGGYYIVGVSTSTIVPMSATGVEAEQQQQEQSATENVVAPVDVQSTIVIDPNASDESPNMEDEASQNSIRQQDAIFQDSARNFSGASSTVAIVATIVLCIVRIILIVV